MFRLKLLFSRYILKALMLIGMLSLTACDIANETDIKQLQEKFNSPEGCFACQFFRIIYNTSAKMSASAYDTLCDIALSLLVIGLTAWLLWHVLKMLISMREPNLVEFWVTLIQMLFKGGFIAIFVGSKKYMCELINTILEPIALIFINLSQKLVQHNWTSQMNVATINSNFVTAPGFPAGIGNAVENLIYRITLALNIGRILGLRLMLSSDIANFWLGLFLTYIFFMMTLCFPLYLIDGFIKMALVLALLPIFLVSWLFNLTKRYIKTAWDIFFGAFTQIMVACIFISIFIAVFEGFITLRGYGYLLLPEIQDADKLFKEDANQMSFAFLSFMLIAYYMYKLSKGISKFTAHFTGAPEAGIMVGAIERAKKAAKALALAIVAVVAATAGLTPVAKVAAQKAKEEGKDAIKGGGKEQ